MNIDLYRYSLCIALTLMAFFVFRFFFGKVPDKRLFANYLRSRNLMGAALLVLAANYAVHLCFDIRQVNVNAAIVMNLSTYFFGYGLFVAALHTLLNRSYITRKIIVRHCLSWLLYVILSVSALLFTEDGTLKAGLIYSLALMLALYGFSLASHLLKAYHRAVKKMDDTYSDHIATYVRWMSVLTYWMLIFGIGCSVLTFLPDNLVFVWVLSSVPFYIYLYVSYQNYMLFYETVECAIESDPGSDLPATETFSCNPENATSCAGMGGGGRLSEAGTHDSGSVQNLVHKQDVSFRFHQSDLQDYLPGMDLRNENRLCKTRLAGES